MPIYDYKCDNGHRFEAMQSISDEPITECDVCGAPARRVLHAPAVHFKGSGFYTTDYARKAAKSNGADSAKPDSKESQAKGSDAKSETSSASKGDKAASKQD